MNESKCNYTIFQEMAVEIKRSSSYNLIKNWIRLSGLTHRL